MHTLLITIAIIIILGVLLSFITSLKSIDNEEIINRYIAENELRAIFIANNKCNFITENDSKVICFAKIVDRAIVKEKTINNFNPSKVFTSNNGMDDNNWFFIGFDSTSNNVVLYGLLLSPRLIKYSDIIDVELIIDNTSISKKSATRTVGGALIGGLVAGGVGAIIGGLSGENSISDKIRTIELKFRIKNLDEPTVLMRLFDSYNSNGVAKELTNLSQCSEIVDLISVIIEERTSDKQINADDINVQNNSESVIDQLIKLADLKERGILTEEEFNSQKNIILTKS